MHITKGHVLAAQIWPFLEGTNLSFFGSIDSAFTYQLGGITYCVSPNDFTKPISAA